MLTQRFLNIHGIFSVAFMVVVLVLVWLKVVPPSYYLPLFLVALAIWASRLVMRFMLARREKQEGSDGNESANH